MIAELIQRRYNELLRVISDSRPFFDAELISWVKEVESEWTAIRDEMYAALNEQFVPTVEATTAAYDRVDADKWWSYWFYLYGMRVPENCQRCPRTVAALKRIPHMTSAFFSILAPRTTLAAHVGAFRGVLRYHLALEVPQDKEKCRIRVLDEVRHWEAGRSLVFDDTYEHEVWNDTDERRVVLFVDVLRPLPWPMSWVNSGMVRAIRWFHPFVRTTVNRARHFAVQPRTHTVGMPSAAQKIANDPAQDLPV